MKLLLLSLLIIFSCNNSTEPSCTEIVDCAGVCGGSSVEDACGECGGDGSTCEAVDGMWIIYYNTSIPIAGFQFDVDGVGVISAFGGAASSAGFVISSSATRVLGFSLDGATISEGEGVLVVLDISGSGNACIVDLDNDLIISGDAGLRLPATVEDCNTIQIP